MIRITTMDLITIMKKYGTNNLCAKMLEDIRWKEGRFCPYCGSLKTSVKSELNRMDRHQCNDCHKSFSVLTNTIFHKARKLPEWFMVIGLMLNAKKSKSSHEISRDIGIRQATVWEIINKVRKSIYINDCFLLKGILEMDETYIGGKPRTKGESKRGRGTNKTAVVGMLERNGNVKTEVVDKKTKMNFSTLSGILHRNIDVIKSCLITDEYKGYMPMKSIIPHSVINHSEMYSDGFIHTNCIEGFWSLIKRAWYGSHHHYARRNTSLYISETCYKYNNRNNKDIFIDTIKRMLT